MRCSKFVAALSFAIAATAQAADYEVRFSGEGYFKAGAPSTVIQSPLSGKFTVEGADPIIFGTGKVTSFNMTIAGYEYTLENVSVLAEPYSGISFYGLEGGTQLVNRVNDFSLEFFAVDRAESESGMMYSVPGTERGPRYVTGFQFSVTAVPEASAVAFAGFGLVVAALAARRRPV